MHENRAIPLLNLLKGVFQKKGLKGVSTSAGSGHTVTPPAGPLKKGGLVSAALHGMAGAEMVYWSELESSSSRTRRARACPVKGF